MAAAAAAARARAYARAVVAGGCSIRVAAGKHQVLALPRMRAADANVVRITGGDLPPCRHLATTEIVFKNLRPIIDLVVMQRHVQVGAVALKWREREGEGGRGRERESEESEERRERERER